MIRINTQIRSDKVRLIDENGNQAGVATRDDALAKARALGLDLVEVVAQADPPVCRMIDFHRYKYEQEKKEKEARRKSHSAEQKEIRLSPVISDHDYRVKLERALEFVKEGHRVKVQLRFRGRQIVHPEIGRALIERMAEDLKQVASIDRPPVMVGRSFEAVFKPLT